MNAPVQLQQRLRLFDATALVVGSMIGSAVFLALPIMAKQVPSPGMLIGLWVFGGLFTILGANCGAELAAMMPRAGGQYVFIREAFGDLWAFLFGWTQFLIIQTGTNAAVAIAFAKYLGSLIPGLSEANVLVAIPLAALLPESLSSRFDAGLQTLNINSAQVVACGVISLLTAINMRGVREGIWVQNLFTVLKCAALAALIVAGLWYRVASPQAIPTSQPIPLSGMLEAGFLAGLAVALSKVLFAYDAWYMVTFVAEEVHASKRTLPLALLCGTVLVTCIYVLANYAYLVVLPVGTIAEVPDQRVAEAVGTVLFGDVGATLVIVAVLISTFGCLNGLVLGGARVCFAMARQGLFLRRCGDLHPRNGTPSTTLIYQGIVSIVLTLTGSYSGLLTYTMFAAVLFMGLMVLALFRLRWTRPDLPRPYRCWGYPVTPTLYLIICLAFLINVIQGEPRASAIGVLFILSGVPFFAVWRRRGVRAENARVL